MQVYFFSYQTLLTSYLIDDGLTKGSRQLLRFTSLGLFCNAQGQRASILHAVLRSHQDQCIQYISNGRWKIFEDRLIEVNPSYTHSSSSVSTIPIYLSSYPCIVRYISVWRRWWFGVLFIVSYNMDGVLSGEKGAFSVAYCEKSCFFRRNFFSFF